MSFQAYLENIKAKTGKSPADFKRLAEQKGFLQNGQITAVFSRIPGYPTHKQEFGNLVLQQLSPLPNTYFLPVLSLNLNTNPD